VAVKWKTRELQRGVHTALFRYVPYDCSYVSFSYLRLAKFLSYLGQAKCRNVSYTGTQIYNAEKYEGTDMPI